jgi:DNA-binding Lrp family transcriptional regulator
MAAKAFVLIETAVGKTKDVIATLQRTSGIKTVDAVTGPYDIIAVVEEDDLNAVGNLVTTRVHPIEGVTRTVTCLAIRVS